MQSSAMHLQQHNAVQCNHVFHHVLVSTASHTSTCIYITYINKNEVHHRHFNAFAARTQEKQHTDSTPLQLQGLPLNCCQGSDCPTYELHVLIRQQHRRLVIF